MFLKGVSVDSLGPAIGGLGFLALIVGSLLFIPLSGLKPWRKVAKRLAIGGGVAFLVALIISPAAPPASIKPTEQAAEKTRPPVQSKAVELAVKQPPPEPVASIKIDKSLLPIVNADVMLKTNFPKEGLVEGAAVSAKEIARQIMADPASQNFQAVNVMVYGGADPWLHFTVSGNDLRSAVAADAPPFFFLSLGREVGFNDVPAEIAAKAYCQDVTVGFCGVIK